MYYVEGSPGWGATLQCTPTASFTPWGKYVAITSDQSTYADTGNWLGTLEVTLDPWVWCELVP